MVKIWEKRKIEKPTKYGKIIKKKKQSKLITMEILINLVIFVIVLFLYLHISFQLKINNDLEVLEIEEPTKGQLEEICDLRQPVLFNFNNKISDEIQLDNIFNNYSAFDIKIRNKNKIEKDQELYLPLSLKELKIVFENDTEKKYISEKNYDFLEETSLIKHFNNNDLFLRPEFVLLCCNICIVYSGKIATKFINVLYLKLQINDFSKYFMLKNQYAGI